MVLLSFLNKELSTFQHFPMGFQRFKNARGEMWNSVHIILVFPPPSLHHMLSKQHWIKINIKEFPWGSMSWLNALLTVCFLQSLLTHPAVGAGRRSPEDCGGAAVLAHSILGKDILPSSCLPGKLIIWAEMFRGYMDSFGQIEIIQVWEAIEAIHMLLFSDYLSFGFCSI